MPEKKYPVVDRRQIVMRWGDMDALGHLNNTCYFRYLEQIRLDWLESLGHSIQPQGCGPVIAATSCSYRRPLIYPATVEVSIELEHLGRSSLKMRHHFRRQGEPDIVYAHADVTLVWIDYQSGNAVALPDDIRQVLAPFAALLNQAGAVSA